MLLLEHSGILLSVVHGALAMRVELLVGAALVVVHAAVPSSRRSKSFK